MVDAVGGSPVTSQLQTAATVSLAAIKNDREQAEAVVRSLDQSTRAVAADTAAPDDSGRGRNLDVKV